VRARFKTFLVFSWVAILLLSVTVFLLALFALKGTYR